MRRGNGSGVIGRHDVSASRCGGRKRVGLDRFMRDFESGKFMRERKKRAEKGDAGRALQYKRKRWRRKDRKNREKFDEERRRKREEKRRTTTGARRVDGDDGRRTS